MISIVEEKGKGRAIVVLYDDQKYQQSATSVFELLSKKSRVLLLSCKEITNENRRECEQALSQILEEKRIRQSSFVSFGSAAIPVFCSVLKDSRFARTLILIDPPTHPHPGVFSKMLQKIEQGLPLGLPFRLSDKGFDIRAFVQRIRCPVLIIQTSLAGFSEHQDTQLLQSRIPSAWCFALEEESSENIANLVMDFQDVRARCPQKNINRQNYSHTA